MNEDLKPCYDLEGDWEFVPEGYIPGRQVFRHKGDRNLFRIMDFRSHEVWFSDTMRVKPEDVIDIYRKVSLKEKAEFMPIILKVIDDIKPIKMPYLHEEIKVYIESHKKCIGLLYFKDTDEERSIVPVKRFFEIKRDPVRSFEEITWGEFHDIAESEEEDE